MDQVLRFLEPASAHQRARFVEELAAHLYDELSRLEEKR